jgi:hypothetical protein
MFWVRHLATISEASAPDDEGEAIVARVLRLASKFDNLTVDDRAAEGPTATRTNVSAPNEVSLSVEHLGASTKAALGVTLDNLEAALSLLASRLRADGWSALVWRRRL